MKNSTSCPQPLTKAGYLLGHLDVTRLLAALALEDSSSVLVELQSPSQLQFDKGETSRQLTLREVMTTLEGWMPTGEVAALLFSMWTRSTWMTHFFL